MDLSLSGVLTTLANGSHDDKVKTLLALHRRSYHKPPAELRQMLSRAGVQLRNLTLVQEAYDLCDVCKKWRNSSATPIIKTSLSHSFNDLVYGDIVFLTVDDWKFLTLVDDCTRFSMVHYTPFRDFEDLELSLIHI